MIFCQQNQTTPSSVKQDYLAKSKRQKTAAWLLVAGGVALVTVGAVIDPGDPEFNILCLCYTGSNDDTKGLIIASGIGALGGSIPLFLASARNKRKAISMSVNVQKVPQLLQDGKLKSRSFPSLSLNIGL